MVSSSVETGVLSAADLDTIVSSADPYAAPGKEKVCFKSTGTAMLNAVATSAVMAEALGYRSWGFLAKLFRRTLESAGGRLGLIVCGSAGMAMRCCIIIPVRLSPLNGGTPVNIS